MASTLQISKKSNNNDSTKKQKAPTIYQKLKKLYDSLESQAMKACKSYSILFEMVSSAGQWRMLTFLILTALASLMLTNYVFVCATIWTQALLSKQLNILTVGLQLVRMGLVM